MGRRDAALAAGDRLKANRQSEMSKIATHDSAYVAISAGPARLFKALYTMTQDPAMAWWMLLIKA